MGTIIDRGLAFIETFTGPFDWRLKRDGRDTAYTGRFLIFDRGGAVFMRIAGRVVTRDSGTADVYIYDPPIFVKNHRHAGCLQLLTPGDRWFKLHFAKPARDFPSAYSFVEHFLTEAYNARN